MSKKRKHRRKSSKLRKPEPLVTLRDVTPDEVRSFFAELRSELDNPASVVVEDDDGFTLISGDGVSQFFLSKKA